ncbi:MAG: acyl-CoA thioesterase [Planctomycetes bacterium]|nr:acyl-CoA thioesterase [Planctomycetota bacterium]
MSFAVRTRVRYVETDQMGVVYHANYLVYFELARTEWMRSGGVAYAAMEDGGTLLVVTRAELDYVASARYDDPLRIEVELESHRKASIRLVYRIFHDHSGRLLARGATELASVDRKSGAPRRLPDGFVEQLRAIRSGSADSL